MNGKNGKNGKNVEDLAKAVMHSAWERYNGDVEFHAMVTTAVNIVKHNWSLSSDERSAATMATAIALSLFLGPVEHVEREQPMSA